MNIFTKVVDRWRKVKLAFFKIGGVWKPIRHAYVKKAGQWKLSYSRPRIDIYAIGLIQTVIPSDMRGVWFNNAHHITGVANRSWTVGLIGADGFIFNQETFDLHSSGDIPLGTARAQAMASKLNGLPAGQLFFIVTYDEPATNRLLGGLPAALYRVGVSPNIIEKMQYRSAYLILGRVGRRCYYENYIGKVTGQGNDDGDPMAMVALKFFVEEGQPKIQEATMVATFNGLIASEDFISGDDLAAQIGLTAGVSINSTTAWMSFTRHGKKLFVPQYPLRSSSNWQHLYAAGAVFGDGTVGVRPNAIATAVLQNKRVTIGGKEYIVRLLKGTAGGHTYTSTAEDLGNDTRLGFNSEWNDLHYLITNDPTIVNYDGPKITFLYSPADLGFTPDPSNGPRIRFCQEVNANLGGQTMARGNTNNVTDVIPNRLYDTTSTANTWVPCLELVE